MRRYYCTLFDKNYLPSFLALFSSLQKTVQDVSVFCFCMDEESNNYLKKFDNEHIVAISHTELHRFFPSLEFIKKQRSIVEYYFTCTPFICSYVLANYQQIDLLTYLDADLYFFSSPEPIYDELSGKSVGIIAHKHYGLFKYYLKYGKYNVGWITFRNDEDGRNCLADWKEKCENWCFDRLEDGKFADQKYLDEWKHNFNNVHIIEHLGANLAPWNVGQYTLHYDIKSEEVFVNNQHLIFYHFASFKQVDEYSYTSNCNKYFVFLRGVLKENIYTPYLVVLRHYCDILGYKYTIKNRKEVIVTNHQQSLKKIVRFLRKVIFKDSIKLPA